MAENSTTRFSNRVEDYVKHRPGYPAEIIRYLREEYALTTDKLIADIGAGTGISARLFLEADYNVTAVEPNKEMRGKSIALLGAYPSFKAVDETAEHTTLADKAADAIIAGQAFHWFDQPQCKTEFKRILKPNGIVTLIWNERKTSAPFEKDYDALILKHASDYKDVNHRNINAQHISLFFYPASCSLKILPNEQVFDFNGLLGRLLSSSYMPARGDAGFKEMVDDLEKLFEQYEENGKIAIGYDCKVYAGRMDLAR